MRTFISSPPFLPSFLLALTQWLAKGNAYSHGQSIKVHDIRFVDRLRLRRGGRGDGGDVIFIFVITRIYYCYYVIIMMMMIFIGGIIITIDLTIIGIDITSI